MYVIEWVFVDLVGCDFTSDNTLNILRKKNYNNTSAYFFFFRHFNVVDRIWIFAVYTPFLLLFIQEKSGLFDMYALGKHNILNWSRSIAIVAYKMLMIFFYANRIERSIIQ